KPGIGRIALESGAAVVPVAILGSYKVRNWKRLEFPKITVEYGKPFKFTRVPEPTREQQQQAADDIFNAIKELHRGLQQRGDRRPATAAEGGVRAADDES